MKTLEELKQYYSNATKEKIIFDNYQDMLRVVELQQENEQLKADYGNKAQVERDILLQQKEELINKLQKAIEGNIDFYQDSEQIQGLVINNVLKRLLNTLKESDK